MLTVINQVNLRDSLYTSEVANANAKVMRTKSSEQAAFHFGVSPFSLIHPLLASCMDLRGAGW